MNSDISDDSMNESVNRIEKLKEKQSIHMNLDGIDIDDDDFLDGISDFSENNDIEIMENNENINENNINDNQLESEESSQEYWDNEEFNKGIFFFGIFMLC